MNESDQSKKPDNTVPHPPVSGPLAELETWLYEMLVAKAPFELPLGAKQFIVQYGPWITLVLGLLLLPPLLAIIGLGSAVSMVALGVGVVVGPLYYLAMLVLVVTVGIMFVSVPKLIARQRSGWQLLFYSDLISFVYGVLAGSFISAIFGAVIGLYILFQIRSYYVK